MGQWLITVALFAVVLFFCTRNTSFPYYYEKDAHSKVAQVVSGHRNFLHPPLMLNAADLVIRVTGMERTDQNAVVAGRFCMAFFTAGAVAAFALMAYRMRGPLAALGVGMLLASHQLVFELSHYFKEDPALLFGLALSFLGYQLYWEKRSLGTAIFLGIACALAVSGKYVGIAAIAMAVALFLYTGRVYGRVQRSHWIALFSSFVLTIAIVDYQFVVHFKQFLSGFEEEMRDVTRKDKRDQIPQFKMVKDSIFRYTTKATWFLLGVSLFQLFRHDRRNPIRWLLILYPFIFLNVLLWSPRLFTRHFLPVLAVGGVFAILALPYVGQQLKLYCNRWKAFQRVPETVFTLALLAVAFFGYELKRSRPMYKTFANPSREAMIAYINQNLPKDAVIAFDERAYLLDRHGNPRTDHPVERKAVTQGRLSDFITLDAVYATGATHVLAHSVDSKMLFPREGEPKEEPQRVKGRGTPQFYKDLEAASEQVLLIPPGRSSYISPGLRLFKLKPRE